MYKKHYSRFLSHLENKLHFAAHSHHAWPDVSREAHLQYWDDSAKWMDEKWSYIFQTVIPESRQIIAKMMALTHDEQIVFAPNTHELVIRLLSTFDSTRPIRILTTENEFHSFRRQVNRMAESGMVQITRLQADTLANDRSLFFNLLKTNLQENSFDLLFMSQVFFDSGLAIKTEEIQEIVKVAPSKTVICIDGYHSFAALPTDWSKLQDRVFFIGGGYKYAQAGEGACFMVIPPGNWRPINTGWFAEHETLSTRKNLEVSFSKNASAFAGSTFDPSGIYRLRAVWKLFEKEGITTRVIHEHVIRLQELFLNSLNSTMLSDLELVNRSEPRGHFLTFDANTVEKCEQTYQHLLTKGIKTDYRGSRLRIGFGLYQDEADVKELVARIQK